MNSLDLDDLGLELPCAQCGGVYRLPLKSVALSHRMLHDGCPVADERECPPVFYGPLVEASLLVELEALLGKLGQQAQGAGGRLVALAAAGA
jgi:hypothetical protein